MKIQSDACLRIPLAHKSVSGNIGCPGLKCCLLCWLRSCAAAVSSLKAGDAQQVFQTALALPAALPPGAEALALRALSSAFQTALFGPVLAAACQALQNLKDSGSSLALAAAGVTFKQMLSICNESSEQPGNSSQHSMHSRLATPNQERSAQSGASPGRDLPQQESAANGGQSSQQQQQQQQQPWQKLQQQQDLVDLQFPLEPLPDDSACCQRLLQGYSAAWLGLVPAGPSADALSPDGAQVAMQQTGPLLLQPSGKLRGCSVLTALHASALFFWHGCSLISGFVIFTFHLKTGGSLRGSALQVYALTHTIRHNSVIHC